MMNTHDSIVERRGERGSALVGVLLLLMMMSALAAALSVSGQTETLISRNEHAGAQAQAAAEAGLSHAVQLVTAYISNWNANGLASRDAAVDDLLKGPDHSTGTELLDADNTSLGTRDGIEDAEAIPLGTRLDIADAFDAEYEALVMDDEGTAPDEDGDPYDDVNDTLIVRATGYGPDGATVTLEAVISPVLIGGALVTNGSLTMSGNVSIEGDDAGVHSNGDLGITGNVDVEGPVTASGEYTGTLPGTEGVAELSIPEIHAIDYQHHADFILTSDGTMTNLTGTVLCATPPCNNWSFNSGSNTWSVSGNNVPTAGTYYVEGDISMSGNGTAQISIIAEGSINISGNRRLNADTPELLFVTDEDLELSGNVDAGITTEGQMLVREQVKLSGNAELLGQLIVENAASVSSLVTSNDLSGNVVLTYNGGLGDGTFVVSGWRDIRDDD